MALRTAPNATLRSVRRAHALVPCCSSFDLIDILWWKMV